MAASVDPCAASPVSAACANLTLPVRDIDRADQTRNKHTMPVSLKDILEAFEFVSADNADEHQAFLSRQSGKSYWYAEYSDDELSELPDDIDDSEKYVQIPDKRELDLGKPLVLEFVRQPCRARPIKFSEFSPQKVPTPDSRI